MGKEHLVSIVLRNNSSEGWEKNKAFILNKGEVGIEIGANDAVPKIKIGNGKYSWEKLPYFSPSLPKSYTWGNLRGTALENAAEQTEYLGLTKPGYGDNASIRVLNDNFDKLDLSYNDTLTLVRQIEKRVDKIIASTTPGQSTSIDINELIDLRTRANGVEYETAGAAMRAIDEDLQHLSENLSSFIGSKVPDGLSYSDSYLQLTSNGEPIGDPVEIISGSGGGGGSSSYIITLTNLLSSRIISVASGASVVLHYNYKSADSEGYSDGNGVGALFINNVQLSSFVVSQGDNEIDITSYLADGSNNVKIKVTNSEGTYKTLSYTVNVLTLSITSTSATMATYNIDNASFQYTISGAGTKIVHFVLDGVEIKTETVTSTGQSRQFTLSRQPDGAHTLKIYATASSEGGEIKSNELSFGMIWYRNETSEPIILFGETVSTATQGDSIVIPYLVYHPHYETIPITREIINEGEIYKTDNLIVDRNSKEWATQDYPVGNVIFRITCENISAQIEIKVSASTFTREIYTDDLLFEFNATGRSNFEPNPAYWNYNGINASFTNVGWQSIDGWLTDSDGQAMLRLLPESQMTIPFMPFENEISNIGYTIEVELATQNVSDYETVIASSFSGERGLLIKSQSASLKSEQSETVAQFKEDDRVRLDFVIEQNSKDSSGQSTSNRLIYIYINGVLCGVQQYAANDQFRQTNPVGLTIGADACGIDVYFIRFYKTAFTAEQQLNNYICDRPSLAEKIKIDNFNDILDPDASDMRKKVTIDSLKGSIPYMVMQCPELPQYKGDKKKGMSCYFRNPAHPEKNFTATNCQFNVQGTSSAGYPVKNYKISFKGGIIYDQSGETAEGYTFNNDTLPCHTLCLKADYASSEHANNTCLVDYYCMTNPWKMPPQQIDERVRQGVIGEPIVLFWENTETKEIRYEGMYNQNTDKSCENFFGFTDIDISSLIPDDKQRIECWEFLNNNTEICLFQSDADFDATRVNSNGETYPAWQDSIEPRYPDLDKMYSQVDAIRRVFAWVASTNITKANNTALAEPKYYQTRDTVYNSSKTYYRDNAGQTQVSEADWNTSCFEKFETDTEDYRLAKFKAEFTDYFYLQPMTFYYLFTEVFLMTDSRAKNMFLTTFDGIKWFPLPYDFDTACGINNEGALVFDYNLEDTDIVDGAYVFNGQESVLWINFAKCFYPQIKSLYNLLRSESGTKAFSYSAVSTKMNNHQSAWCENLWNLDAEIKYLQPFYAGSNNLAMAQGNKQTQRDFWLFNGFKYRDSKYEAGEAVTNYIHLRIYNKGEIAITPYSHIYARVEFGNAKDELKRCNRNETVVFNTDGITTVNDLETHIYSSDRIAKIGDLSPLKVGYCDFSYAPKLQQIIIGSEDESYSNGNLTTFTLGASDLLSEINISNCYNLATTIDASRCPCLEIFKAFGTKITGVNFSNGGRLKIVRLPETIASLIIRNQTQIEELSVKSYANISTLWIESSPNIPFETIIAQSEKLDRVRLYNVEWETANEASLQSFYNKVITCKGLDATGLTSDKPVVTGKVKIASISEAFLEQLNATFPELIVEVAGQEKYFIKYVDYNNNELYKYIANGGDAAIDPVATGILELSGIPIPADTETTKYSYNGWVNLPTSIDKSYTIRVKYLYQFRVRFMDAVGSPYNEQWIEEGKAATQPSDKPQKAPTAQYSFTFSEWDKDFTEIVAPVDISPVYTSTLNTYVVQFWTTGYYVNGEAVPLKTQIVSYGDTASYSETLDGKVYYYVGGEPSPYYTFYEWDSSLTITPEVYTEEPIVIHAVFTFSGTIEDDWATIAANAAAGNVDKYGLGGVKAVEITVNGQTYSVEMELVAKNFDKLAETSADYNSGATNASFTFITKNVMPFKRYMNATSGVVGGWEKMTMREWLMTDIYTGMTEDVATIIKSVEKISDYGTVASGGDDTRGLNTTQDKLWIPSMTELNMDGINTTTDTVYYENQSANGEGYPWFSTDETRIKRDGSKIAQQYWTRTHPRNFTYRMCTIWPNGSYFQNNETSNAMTTTQLSFIFGFCI